MSDRVTMREAAEVAGVHRNTIRNWVKAGKLETARLEPEPDGRGEIWLIDRDELQAKGLLAGASQTAPVTAATETETAAQVAAPVPEGYELVPAGTLERLLDIATSYAESGERVGRAEATSETLRERLDETRNALAAERQRTEDLKRRPAGNTTPLPAAGGTEPEERLTSA